MTFKDGQPKFCICVFFLQIIDFVFQDKVLTIQQREEETTCLTGENLLTLAATFYTLLLRFG